MLRDPTGKGPNLSFQARDRRPERRDRKVERLIRLGARRYPWRDVPHADFVVLEDPSGTLFCVVQAVDAR